MKKILIIKSIHLSQRNYFHSKTFFFCEIFVNEYPPHRLYDHEMKLIPNSVLYYGPIYPPLSKKNPSHSKYILMKY